MLGLVRAFVYRSWLRFERVRVIAGLSGFAIFVSVLGVIVPLFLLLIPVVDVRYGKFTRLSRALMEVRVGFILTGGGVAVSLLIAYVSFILSFDLYLTRKQIYCNDIRVHPTRV